MDRYARGGFNVGYEARVDVRQLRAKRIAEAHKECRAALEQLLSGRCKVEGVGW